MPRGKYSKPTRGGGKKFSRDLRPLDETPGMWDAPEEPKEDDDDSEDDSDEEEEEEDEDGKPTSSKAGPVITEDMTREERKAAQKALKEAKRAKASAFGAPGTLPEDEDEEENEEAAEVPKPKQPKAAVKGFETNNLNSQGAISAEPTMSRREREVVEAAAAKERYRKLHEAGKTDEAKSDLARLAIIKKEREEKRKQREAELEEKKRVAEIKAANSGKKK